MPDSRSIQHDARAGAGDASEDSVDGAVFVDPTGRRYRRWRVVGAVTSLLLLVYLGVLVAAVLFPTTPVRLRPH